MQDSRLSSIDALRGMAALGVLLVHIPHMPTGPLFSHPFGVIGLILDFGRMGVPLFIVLSGFCIHRSTRHSRHPVRPTDVSWLRFFARRLERLYVPYAGAILLGLLAILSASGWAGLFAHLPFDVVTHLCMVQNLFIYAPQGVGNGPLWTIGLEFQLYCLYPVVFFAAKKWGWLSVLSTVLCINLIWALFVPWKIGTMPGHSDICFGAPIVWPFEYWFIWCLGALASELVDNGTNQNMKNIAVVATFFVILGFACDFRTLFLIRNSSTASSVFSPWLVTMDFIGGAAANGVCIISFGVFFFCVLIAAQRMERSLLFLNSRFLNLFAKIGVISYSLYLTHTPVMSVLHRLITIESYSPSVVPWMLGYLLNVPACLAFAGCYFWCIERHFLFSRMSPSRSNQQTNSEG